MSVDSPFAALLAGIPIEKHEVSVLGSTTRYWVYGDPNASTTVVISHGYRGEHHGLEPVIAQLPGIRWISPDLPGFGESTPLKDVPHSIEGYARWLIEFFAALGLTGKAIALGHSFGSIISSQAIVLGLDTPRLILINPIAISGLEGPKPLATKLTVWYYRLYVYDTVSAGYGLYLGGVMAVAAVLLSVWAMVAARASAFSAVSTP